MTIVKKIMTGVLFIAMSVSLFSFDLPTGLFKAGSNPKSYEMGIEKGSGQDGKKQRPSNQSLKKIKDSGL